MTLPSPYFNTVVDSLQDKNNIFHQFILSGKFCFAKKDTDIWNGKNINCLLFTDQNYISTNCYSLDVVQRIFSTVSDHYFQTDFQHFICIACGLYLHPTSRTDCCCLDSMRLYLRGSHGLFHCLILPSLGNIISPPEDLS